ncbi:hypothetical protein L6452_17216 [Arctium lappa]|uniref:Uncharacterized protein n=1 Tax=Arctium lappa TaxID=4217 RepID=A0ACB9C2V1_ARCLA|nr:hypothetical protein L6452_17216 [Arctium lappa]
MRREEVEGEVRSRWKKLCFLKEAILSVSISEERRVRTFATFSLLSSPEIISVLLQRWQIDGVIDDSGDIKGSSGVMGAMYRYTIRDKHVCSWAVI